MILSILIACGVIEIFTGVTMMYPQYIGLSWIALGIVFMNWIVVGITPIISIKTDAIISNVFKSKLYLMELAFTAGLTIIMLYGVEVRKLAMLIVIGGWLKAMIPAILQTKLKFKKGELSYASYKLRNK